MTLRLARWAALALAYVISGKLALALALPPGYASAIFPPAGIAVASVFIWGRAALPAVGMGSLVLNLWVGWESAQAWSGMDVAIAAWIAIASTLQAAVGGWVLRRFIGYPAAFDQAKDVLRFLLLAPLICLVSASLSVSGLTGLGAFQAQDLASNMLTWWVGDTLGVIVLLPLVMTVCGEPRALWRHRRYSVGLPMVVAFAVLVFLFHLASRWEQDEALAEFRVASQQVVDEFQDQFAQQEVMVENLAAFVAADERGPVTRAAFRAFVSRSLTRFPDTVGFGWATRVEGSQRQRFEADLHAQGFEPEIWQLDAAGHRRRAAERDYYYPIVYAAPDERAPLLVGFDTWSSSAHKQLIRHALDSASPVASAPMPPVQGVGLPSSTILTMRVGPDATASGVVFSVLRFSSLAEHMLAKQEGVLRMRLTDIEARTPLYDTLGAVTAPVMWQQNVSYGGRVYLLEFAPAPIYVILHRGWKSWGALAVGLLGNGLLGALLMLGTGYTARVETQVSEHIKELTENTEKLQGLFDLSPLGIALTDMNGRYIEFNEAFRRLTGYSGDELRQLDYWSLTPKKYEADEAVQLDSLRRTGRYGPYVKEYRRKDGSLVPLSLNGMLITGRSGESFIWSIVEDISQRQQMEQKLRDSEKRWKFALEGAGDGLWDWNMQTGALYLSRQEMTVLGYEGEGPLWSSIGDWVERQHPQDRSVRQAALQAHLSGQAPIYRCEFRTQGRDGRWRWILARGLVVSRSADGQPLRMIGTHSDIDERKRQEAQDTVRRDVMEMLAQRSKLHDVLDAIILGLERGELDLAYAIVGRRDDGLHLLAGRGLPPGWQMPVLAVDGCSSPAGVAIANGQRIEQTAPDSPYAASLAACAASVGLTVCYSEPILSGGTELEGVLVSFRTKVGSDSAPDLTLLQQAANLASIAIQRKRADDQLMLVNSVFENSSEGVMVVDADTRIVAVNPAFVQITGYGLQEVLGRSPKLLQSGRQDARFYHDMWHSIDTVGRWQGELVNRRKNGDVYPQWMSVDTIYDEDNQVLHRVCVFSDITERKQAEQRIAHLAYHDLLTDLPNRVLFSDRLQRAMASARREQRSFALLYVDLDKFKPVNDQHGHKIGDLLLQRVAARMQECVRDSDTVARLGGDEFGVILPNIASADDGAVVAEKIHQALRTPFDIEGRNVRISCSIGGAVFPMDGEDEEQLVQSTDKALYQVKHGGRDGVRFARAESV